MNVSLAARSIRARVVASSQARSSRLARSAASPYSSSRTVLPSAVSTVRDHAAHERARDPGGIAQRGRVQAAPRRTGRRRCRRWSGCRS
ncbi:hypothetical protein [Actinomadura formosensis]|uniref:hypothetical protein n=1 Tax=Actinomadura formosensis TaxID=60706 RepID=UPI0012FA6018|nr:hypothetical protein [Actinomadura formosensis]